MRAAFRFRDRRVAVDDEKVEARTFRKEGFPYPQHILIGLHLERYPGPQAGMHENVRPDAGVDWQAGQKLAVGLWDCADQCVLERLKPQATLVQEIVYIDAVGQKRLAAPEIQPVHVVLRIFKKIAE